MNYYGARQRQSDLRYDFTCTNDGKTWPVGYCGGYREYTAADFNFMGEELAAREAAKLNAKYGPLKEHFHADGHATEAEAQACYRRFLLDTRLEFSKDRERRVEPDTQKKCAHCGTWTTGEGWVDSHYWWLCPEHQTREVVELLMPSIGTITSSY